MTNTVPGGPSLNHMTKSTLNHNYDKIPLVSMFEGEHNLVLGFEKIVNYNIYNFMRTHDVQIHPFIHT